MRLVLAGAENSSTAKILKEIKAPNVLLSYYSLRGKSDENVIKEIEGFRNNGAEYIFLDSGAFSFFTQSGIVEGTQTTNKGTILKETENNPETYFNGYLEWLGRLGKLFDVYCELDVGRILGTDKVREWRRQLEEAGLKDKLIVVWHPDETDFQDYIQLCKTYKFVAVPGRSQMPQYVACLNEAKKYGTKIHGFGLTKQDIMEKAPFYSVDSTSWLSGAQFGMTYVFNGASLLRFGKDDKNERRKYKVLCDTIGVSYEGLLNDVLDAVNKFNAYAWIQYGKELDRRQVKYWEEEIKPNELNNEPKESINRGDYLPEETKGKIMEIRKDPEIEKKRIEAVKEWNKKGLANLKNGEFSSILGLYPDKDVVKGMLGEDYNPTDLITIYKDFLKVLDNKDTKAVKTAFWNLYIEMSKVELIRVFKAMNAETAFGGMLDKSLTKALDTAMSRMERILGMSGLSFVQNINIVQLANDITNGYTSDERKGIATRIREFAEGQIAEGTLGDSGSNRE